METICKMDITDKSVADLFYEQGTRIEAVGNRQLELWHDDSVCWVNSGHLDFFVTQLSEAGRPEGALHWCHSLDAGVIFFCDSTLKGDISLLSRGTQGTVVFKLDRCTFDAALKKLDAPEDWIGPHVKGWVEGLVRNLIAVSPQKVDHHFKNEERAYEVLEPGIFSFGMRNHHAAWLKVPGGKSTLKVAGIMDMSDAGVEYVPLTPELWYDLEVDRPTTLTLKPIGELLADGNRWRFLQHFNRFFIFLARARISEIKALEREQYYAQNEVDHRVWKAAVSHLAGVIDHRTGLADAAAGEDALFEACSRVGRAMGVRFKRPENMPRDESLHQKLLILMRASSMRLHKVKLVDLWYAHELMPMVAFREKDGLPVAIVPSGRREYEIVYPDGTPSEPVKEASAQDLEPHAYMFFKSIPDRKLTRKDLAKIALSACRRELWTILIVGFCAGLISLIVPVVTNKIISDVIPGNHYGYLYQIMMGLIAAAVGSTLFELFKAIAILRTNFKAEARIQPAIWDRLLKLPIPFFSSTNAGDLSNRANSLIDVSNQIKGTVVITAMSGIFAAANFFVMFNYHKKLAFCGLGMVAVALLFILLVGRSQFLAARKLYDIQGKISGLVLQLTTGISKLKTAGAEWRAYERWAEMFAAQKRVDMQSRQYVVWQQTFSKAYDPLSRMLIIALLVFHWKDALTPGEYTAFNTAMGAFVVSILSLGPVMEYFSSIFLLFNRVDPIIAAEPELNLIKTHPGNLSGYIEVNNVTFSYQKDGPVILKGISLEAHPGEFIALVGGSGSGKSTLFRLLLGFETPDTGGIFYDGQDLAQLDLDSVRHQMGVVLQNGSLMPGDIFTNIVGASQLSIDDAWRAARRAGMEKDIKAMSMGMFTVVSENAGTFSGGQRQRLMIARAIVNEPKLLLFDEATSALDNTTQSLVSKSVEELNVTRIVIAHRLSTIINSDRIYMMENGKIVQTGNYETLIKQEGPFREQALRQMI
ncbi:MAG: NHLP bacteriocin export ABC transporter permease/ATPase subunit [Deltaproteobacteria bacterium]|nr:NHLP bacteriocin export ABC transporter permease/ATPase subunit [Deltaproteobacteria bacterium]